MFGVHDGGMAVAMFSGDGEFDGALGVGDTNDRHEGHHLFGPDSGVVGGDLGHNLANFGASVNADGSEKVMGIFTDKVFVHVGGLIGAAVFGGDSAPEAIELPAR